jgi:hypothetical protein
MTGENRVRPPIPAAVAPTDLNPAQEKQARLLAKTSGHFSMIR